MRAALALSLVMAMAACSSGDAEPPNAQESAQEASESSPNDGGSVPRSSVQPGQGSDAIPEPTAPDGDEPASTTATPSTTTPSTTTPSTQMPTTDVVVEPSGAGGVVVIDGDEWRFAAEECLTEGGLSLAGAGVGPDGRIAWVDVTLDESVDLDGDGRLDSNAAVSVEVGRTDASQETDEEQPLFYARATRTGGFGYSEFEFTVEGAQMSGSGTMQDYHSVAVPFGEPIAFTFDVACE